MAKKEFNLKDNRPTFPKRAVITGGMPYGNKELHLGHVGGVFIHADTYARFLRDRIGKDNVIFVSGTDCYGSPIQEYYRKINETGEFTGTMEEFVLMNHEKQKDVLNKYGISLNLFSASGFTSAKEIHENVCAEFFNTLYENGHLKKLETEQFYDVERGAILNGRQVVGKCPIDNCTSESAYADECDLGHQYRPKDLKNPISQLTGDIPKMVNVSNWYFDLEKFNDLLLEYSENNENIRALVKSTMQEFLKPPIVYIKEDEMEKVNSLKNQLPLYVIEDTKHKSSVALTFKSLDERDVALEILGKNAIRFRSGKTLVPFRLTGSTSWGVPAPEKEDLKDLTFWVWPESLFAPISFTKAYLQNIGRDIEEYKNFWCDDEARVYQFVGSDNIYFYGIAEMAMFMAMQGSNAKAELIKNELTLPSIIANNHVLFLDKKASSSSEIKPPTALKLLDYYTPWQLKLHFLAFGLASKNVGFKPKPLNPDATAEENDPVLMEGNLYTNVYNRMLRTFFYSTQKYTDNKLPIGEVSEQTLKDAETAILKYEKHMSKYEFHRVIDVLDSYIRNANKTFVKAMSEAEKAENIALINQALVDVLHIIKTISILSHPITTQGSEMVLEYLNLQDKQDEFFCWDNIFDTIYKLVDIKENHTFKFLEPKVDFFAKLDCQF